MLVEFGKAGWIERARQQPDKVRMVYDKIRTDGFLPTMRAVSNKLDQPLALGYCGVGVVLETGGHLTGFSIGDRVVSNGKHAEVVSVPANLCAKVPEGVPDDQAAFTVVAAVGLQGIRLIQPTLGEAVVVTGLGLIGLLALQLLRSHGCRVLGIDFDADKLELAKRFGADVVNLAVGEDPVAAAQRFSRGRGVDAVIITASTKSSTPVHEAALMCRKRGRIVLVGVAGLELSRADFYEKELSFQVSCSYGPGRYDPTYEEKGVDYPIGFVRWTEQRNFEAVLDMMVDGRLDVSPLISHRFRIDEAAKAYDLITDGGPSLGILLDYSRPEDKSNEALREKTVKLAAPKAISGKTTVAFIGSGNYGSAVLIPAFRKAGARLKSVVSNAGLSGTYAGLKHGFEETTTDTDRVLADPDISAVVVTTRHDSHGRLVCKALRAGKDVFVEKPLALTEQELAEIELAYHDMAAAGRQPILMVGFNRRFAPHVAKIQGLLETVKGPKAFVMTVNAGGLAPGHWIQDPAAGGGRITGEACHFVDLLRCLAGASINKYSSTWMESASSDTVTIQLHFGDGSIGTIHYLANGNKAFPKERLEIFAAGRVLQLDNFRKLRGFGWTGFSTMRLWRQDKGQDACVAAFLLAVDRIRQPPVAFDELLEVSRIAIALGNNRRRE